MSDNQARLIILIGLAALMPVGMYHRLRARTGERLDRRQEGWLILLTLRPIALAYMVGLIVFLVRPASMAWSAMHLPPWARWAGVACGIAATLLAVWTYRALGRNLTDTVVTRQNATLVTSGPYHWIRHPFYVAFALALLANVLITDSGYLAVVGAAAFLAIIARTRVEEQNLAARFGQEYKDYVVRTGGFLPRIRR